MSSKLFAEGKIGNLSLRNRTVMPPMATAFSADDGSITERVVNYLAERAKNGIALIVAEASTVHPLGIVDPCGSRIDDDRLIAGFVKLTRAIHAEGAKVALQLGHGGRQCSSKVTGALPVSASPIPYRGHETPKALSVDEVWDLITAFVKAAERAKEAGFDAVEIHGAHGYLITQFLSPLTNRREDIFGGNIQGRTKFACEIVKRIKSQLGPFPTLFRLSADEFVEGGINIDQTITIVGFLEQAGVDAFHVSAGGYDARQWMIPSMYLPEGALVHLAAAVKRAVHVPVIAVGRINSVQLAEEILASGKADFVALGRGLLADPEFLKKASEGRNDEIRRCIGCNRCIDRIYLSKPIECTVNAALGKEREYELFPAKKPKRVMVIGGGPAGTEAARVAALRGHKVTLYEKSDALGGQLKLAKIAPGKEEIGNFIQYQSSQLGKLGVQVLMNQEVTPSFVKEVDPQVVILAAGAVPHSLPIPGVEGPQVMTANEVLAGQKNPGSKVVIIGGGSVGMEVAEFLREKGKEVTILEMLGRVGEDLGPSMKFFLINRLKERGVILQPKTKAVQIQKNQVIAEREGKEIVFPMDSVVLATGVRPNNDLEKSLRGQVPEFHCIGDCVEPGKALEAVAAGFRVGREI